MQQPLQQHYSVGLVCLSVLIGILASYTALDLSGRIHANTGRTRALWLGGVALAMGVGIWSMHFVGMLALMLPTTVVYSLPELVASLAFAIGAAAFALWIAARPTVRRRELAAGAFAMGVAIAGMHYIGMAGMRMAARVQYDTFLFWLSVAIAVVVSYVALFITRRLRAGGTTRMRLARAGASIVMGLAISGMHYTGMAAANFIPTSSSMKAHDEVLPPTFLAGLVAVASILLVGFALIAAMLDRLVRSRMYEAQLRAEKDAAVETNRAKSEFLSNMSHELRTPLNSIIGFGNILLKNKAGNLRPLDVTHLTRITANGRHLLGVINGVLDLSKIEAGRVELEMTLVDLDSLVRETLDEMAPQADALDVQLAADIPAGTDPLLADPARLKQIIINLVSNALKFSRGGRVTVRVITDTHTHLPVRIDVIDTGIGIAKDRLETVFEAFKQADASTTRQFGGTGLGLTITRSLAKLMGWTVVVASEVGVGTTFSVVMGYGALQEQPLSAAAQSQPTESTEECVSAPVITAQSFVVLVIDDEVDARELLQYELEELHCEVVCASSADAGIALARTVKPDLITLDVMMPKKNGWQALRELKADEELRGIPVVIISVVAEETRGNGAGAVDFIDKPVTRGKLRHLIPLRQHRTAARQGRDLADDDGRHLDVMSQRVAIVVPGTIKSGESAGLGATVLQRGEDLGTDLDALLVGFRAKPRPAA